MMKKAIKFFVGLPLLLVASATALFAAMAAVAVVAYREVKKALQGGHDDIQ